MPKPFDLEAAKDGAEILYDGFHCKLVAHVPENDPDWRVVISIDGKIRTLTEDGRYCTGAEVRLTMAPRTVKTAEYRRYYWIGLDGRVRPDYFFSDFGADPNDMHRAPGFLKWIDTEWQQDEVEL